MWDPILRPLLRGLVPSTAAALLRRRLLFVDAEGSRRFGRGGWRGVGFQEQLLVVRHRREASMLGTAMRDYGCTQQCGALCKGQAIRVHVPGYNGVAVVSEQISTFLFRTPGSTTTPGDSFANATLGIEADGGRILDYIATAPATPFGLRPPARPGGQAVQPPNL